MFKRKINETKSAGVVLVHFDSDVPKVLLMRAYNYWDFPKGKLEKNENKLEAAIREVSEEAGISDLNFKWGKTFYETSPYGKDRKRVSYFIAETNDLDVIIEANPDSGIVEHEEFRWVTFDEAKGLASYRINKVLTWAENRIMTLYKQKGV